MTDNNNNNNNTADTTTTTKNDLMASLLMASGADGADEGNGGGDGDLFGDALPPAPELGTTTATGGGIVVSEETPPLAVEDTPPPPLAAAAAAAAATVPPAPQPATETAPSLLAQSGLLGMMGTATDTTTTAAAPDMGSDHKNNNGGGGGGLFDAVDQEEQEAQQRAEEEEEAARQQQKAAEEERQRQQAERQHQEDLARQQQQQQQQQSNNNNMMMMGGGYPPFQDGNNSMMQQSAMMQSVNLNAAATPTNHHAYAGMTTPQQQQQSLQAGMQNMTLQQQQQPPPQAGFYREHPPSVVQTTGGPPPPQNAYGGAGYYYGTQQPQQQQQSQMSHPQLPMPQPNITAGMHNAAMNNAMNAMNHQHPQNQVRKIVLMKPTEVPPVFTNIQVTEPMLIQQASFLISSPPYWSYQISTQLAPPQQGTWLVRRRFKHVVALEDRLRQACPGSILPPRPDKHATRAIEEASAQQSAEFAMQRALELQSYLNALAKHPVAGQSQVFRLFVGLQDDIGTAWPEVSGNAFTKLGAVAANVSSKVAETTSSHQASTRPVQEWEEDAELLGLTSSENVRMGAVCQAVPKLEGTVTLWREYGDVAGAVGMEMSKVTKVPDNADLQCLNVLSTGMLRLGRRNKRLALEMSAAMNTFLQQYKMVRYEKMALQDRRAAMQRRNSTRRGADQRAMYLSQQQGTLQTTGQYGHLNRLEQSAIHTDSFANALMGEADEIAARLKSEIHRVAIERRTQWNASMKTIAKAMKDACTERIVIWESTLEAFEALPGNGGGIGGAPPVMEVNVAATPGAAGNNNHHGNNMMPVSPMMMMDGSMMGGSQMMVNGGTTTAPGDNMMSQSMNPNHMAPPQQQHQQQNEPPMDGSTIYA